MGPGFLSGIHGLGLPPEGWHFSGTPIPRMVKSLLDYFFRGGGESSHLRSGLGLMILKKGPDRGGARVTALPWLESDFTPGRAWEDGGGIAAI